jgi:N-methylhydantoinase A/oxoprolinase/acetone carboxylase beta subunit
MTLSGCTIGVDTGGTFTDVTVLLPDGHAVFNKAPTTPDDFSRGVLAGRLSAPTR